MAKQQKPFSALIVRNIEGSVKKRLQQRARRHGHSMEEEVREILRDAVAGEESATQGLGSQFAELFRGIGLEEPIPEIDEPMPEPLRFE